MICQSVARPQACHTRRVANAGGFSLIEIAVVLVLLGVLTAVAINKFSTTNISAAAEADVFQASLRYAQQRAMGDISTWGISVAADGMSYSLFTNNPSLATNQVLPGVGSITRTLPPGVTMSASGAVANGGKQEIVFDYRGRLAGTGGSGSTAGREYLKTAPLAILGNDVTVTFVGESNRSMIVYAQTGLAK